MYWLLLESKTYWVYGLKREVYKGLALFFLEAGFVCAQGREIQKTIKTNRKTLPLKICFLKVV